MKKFSFTLVELLVVMALISMLCLLTIPVTKAISESFTGGMTLGQVELCLKEAKYLAILNRCYAGLRFQQTKNNIQYTVIIIEDPTIELTLEEQENKSLVYVAVTHRAPINLGKKNGIMGIGDFEAQDLSDTRTSITFDSNGKLWVTNVLMRNNPRARNNIIFDEDGLFPEDTTHTTSVPCIIVYQQDDSEDEGFWESLRPVCINKYTGHFIR